jgi:hypothetical protein
MLSREVGAPVQNLKESRTNAGARANNAKARNDRDESRGDFRRRLVR